MRKRLSSKLLSVILTLAICATTVFGCLMTVNAADSCYSFGSATVNEELTEATIDVTFTAPANLPNGFVSGAFSIDEVDADGADYLTIKSVSGSGVSAGLEGNYVVFETNAAVKVATLKLTFGFSNGAATKGKDYKVQLSDVELAYNDAEYYVESATGAIGTISTECEHVIGVVGEPIKIDAANNYSVYENSVCTICGEKFGIQLVPSADVLITESGSTITWSAEGAADATLIDDADGEQDGSDEHPIIINSVEELYYLAAKAGITETANKYYKLADGISKVVFQSKENASTVIGLADAAAVESNFGSGSWFTWSGDSSKPFAGHFDGNGATFYGLYAKEAMTFGLFPHVAVADDALNADIADRIAKNIADNGATTFNPHGTENYTANTVKVSNLNVKNSYVTINSSSQWSATAGFVFGKSVAVDGYLARYYATIEKCSITNCYMYSGSSSYAVAQLNGLFAGDFSACLKPKYYASAGAASTSDWYGATNGVKMNNCLAYGNSLSANNSYDDTISIAGRANLSTNGMVSNSIFLGVLPYLPPCTTDNADAQITFSSHRGNKANFANIYTDAEVLEVKYSDSPKYDANSNFTSVFTKITDLNSVKGSTAAFTCSALDWGNTWLCDENGGYPYLASKVSNTTIYWDGTTATGIAEGSGTPEEPYIINTVSELAWLVYQSTAQADKGDSNVTKGKYYKIADGIKNIVLQPYAYGADIIALDSAADTKAYFEQNAASMKKWVNEGWEQGTFAGTFDGNGATIYGMYQNTNTNAGLFSTIDAGVTIKNLAVKNSYMVVNKAVDTNKTSGYTDYQLGAIAATSSSNSYGAQAQGVIWINNCEVSNCYMRQNTSVESGYNSRCGVLLGNMQQDIVGVDDCIVYGNDATYGRESTESVNMPLMGHAGYSDVLSTGIKPEGYEPVFYTEYNEDKSVKAVKYVATVRNSIVLGCDVMNVVLGQAWRRNAPGYSYSNVYTDGVSGTVTFPNSSTWTYPENEIKAITYADAIGSAAQKNLPGLAWGEKWYCGANGRLPVLGAFATLGASDVSTYAHQLYGSSVTYNNDGTLDFNLHFVPQYEGIEATLYVGTADTSKFYKLTATESSYRDDLGDTALMFTLPNISARDIDKIWLPTIVVDSGLDKAEWGKTQPIALVDNAKGVLAGDYDAADKKVSAALINYGVTADDALSTPSTETQVATKIVYTPNNMYDGSFMTDAAEGVGDTEDNPYIISTYGHWRYIAEKATFDETYGKFFKVDPTIKMFVFQSESYIKNLGGLNAFLKLDAEGVKTALSTETGRTYHNAGSYESNNNIEFAGTLDGSGVQIVGMYNGCGLFSQVCEGASFKNLTVSHSYMPSGWYGGAVVGYVNSDTASETNPGRISFENIIVHDNYQTTTGTGWSQTGTLVGSVSSAWVGVDIENVISYNNVALGQVSKTDTTMKECGLVGQFHGGWNGGTTNPNGSYKNIITLGCAPYPVVAQQNQGSKPEYFENVYTDTITEAVPGTQSNVGIDATQWSSYDITLIDAGENNANVKNGGAVTLCPKIDWINKWLSADDSGYPAPVQKDVTIKTAGSTIYWDGTYTSENTVDKVNDTNAAGTSWETAIIIDNAEELNWVLQVSANKTNNLFFKIADNIDRIVLQPEGVLDVEALTACQDGAAVQAYLEKVGTANLKNWSSNPQPFSGNLDGNGVEIIGAYGSGAKVGFIGAWDGGKAGAKVTADDEYNYTTKDSAGNITGYYNVNTDNVGITVKNITVKNSYFVSSQRLGVFGAQVQGPNYGAYVDGVMNLDKCAVVNCYLKNTGQASKFGENSIVINSSNKDAVKMSNMLVYGNKALDINNAALWFRGAMVDTAVPVLDAEGVATTEYIKNTVTNSVILGTLPYKGASYGWIDGPDRSNFTNIYTDAPTSVTYTNGAVLSFTSEQLIPTTADDLKGANSQSVVDALNAANDTTVWYVGALDDMPGFKEAGNVPSLYQSAIDSVVFTTPDTVGAGTEYYDTGSMMFGVYKTALSLKANPYMSFAFAFGGDYKENRENIKIRFTYTENGASKTSEEIAVPAYTGEDIKNVNGWTNTTANGRFHTYKAEFIPVEALADGIKVEANYNNTGWKDFGTYSVEGLGMQFDSLSKTQPGDYYSTRVEAAKALLFYAQTIAARYGAQ